MTESVGRLNADVAPDSVADKAVAVCRVVEDRSMVWRTGYSNSAKSSTMFMANSSAVSKGEGIGKGGK